MSTDDLFRRKNAKKTTAPLGDRMRPRTLEEFLGQHHIVGAGKFFDGTRRFLPSLILWGPPGSGKTTLARLLADRQEADWVALSAVSAGVKELREVVAKADHVQADTGRQTVLFIDEIHRFNKGQQDALLPHVESGLLTLIGATTENPSFEVNAALLSRCRVLRLEALAQTDIEKILMRALNDAERGLGQSKIKVPEDILQFIAREAEGDARRALSTLELSVEMALQNGAAAEVTEATVKEALQTRALAYDKKGDQHYGVISAFIKSVRGSDPDASVYWLARLLESGEDPNFVARRMVILASEDIGNADPRALQVAVSAADAFRMLGMPEGTIPLTQAVLYLALAPKSNTAITTYGKARTAVAETGALPVPLHLRNASTPLMRQMGAGRDYEYPHDTPAGIVDTDYLPQALIGRQFFMPSAFGEEPALAEKVIAWRAQRSKNRTTKK